MDLFLVLNVKSQECLSKWLKQMAGQLFIQTTQLCISINNGDNSMGDAQADTLSAEYLRSMNITVTWEKHQ